MAHFLLLSAFVLRLRVCLTTFSSSFRCMFVNLYKVQNQVIHPTISNPESFLSSPIFAKKYRSKERFYRFEEAQSCGI